MTIMSAETTDRPYWNNTSSPHEITPPTRQCVCPLCGGHFTAADHNHKTSKYCPWCKSPIIFVYSLDDIRTVQNYVTARDKYLSLLSSLGETP